MVLCALYLALGGGLLFVVGAFGGWAVLLSWPAASFLGTAIAYLSNTPSVLGKKADGHRPSSRTIFWAPTLAGAELAWHLLRVVRREPCCHQVTPHLLAGRRPRAHEIPPRVTQILDLTAELRPVRPLPDGCRYECRPMLDGLAPPDHLLLETVAWLRAQAGVTYVHCAEGRGRTGLVAGAVLLATGGAANASEAITAVRTARPYVRLLPDQRRQLERLESTLAAQPRSAGVGSSEIRKP